MLFIDIAIGTRFRRAKPSCTCEHCVKYEAEAVYVKIRRSSESHNVVNSAVPASCEHGRPFTMDEFTEVEPR